MISTIKSKRAKFQNGTNIGINTTNINAALDVNGQLRVEDTFNPPILAERNITSPSLGAFPSLHLKAIPPSTPTSDGFGTGIFFSITGNNATPEAKMYAVRNGNDNTASLQFWTGLNASVNSTNILSTGQLQLPLYGGTAFSGTATKSLAVDAGGNVIEIDVAASNVQSNWTAPAGDPAEILNKPTDLVSGTTQSQTAVTQIRTLTSTEYQAITPAADVLYIIV